MRAIVAVLVLAAGCSVDVGAGSIPVVAIDAPIVPPSSDPPVSMPVEVEFLSTEDAQSIADQYGGKLGAVTAVDISVDTLALEDDNGAPISGGALIVGFQGLTIDKVGARVRLPDETRRQLLAAIAQRTAFVVTVQMAVSWTPPQPPAMNAHVVLQPIFVVDGLKAL